MVLRGWGARVCALRKSRTRAREPGGAAAQASYRSAITTASHPCPSQHAVRSGCRAPAARPCALSARRWCGGGGGGGVDVLPIARPRLARRLAAAPPRSWTTPSRHSPTPARAQHAVQSGCGADLLSVRPPLRLVVWVRLLAGQGAETDGSSGVVVDVFSRPSG